MSFCWTAMSAASNAVNRRPEITVSASGVKMKNTAEHVNTGGHHRRGVDERADGRRAFHRVRQPHVQRELRGLADRTAEDQQTGKRRRATEDGWIVLNVMFDEFEIQSSVQRDPQNQDAQHEAEVADAIREERLLRRVRRAGFSNQKPMSR